MKKFVAIMLAALMVLSLAACGTINEAEVSVLWADLADVKLPNSMENSMDKIMYLEKINYAYYDANGDQAAQTKQAEEVLNKGCSVLMVNLVDAAAAQEIADLAKAKNVPVVFFGCEVDAAVVSSYEKCVNVSSDHESVSTVQGEQIGTALIKEEKGMFDFLTGKEPTYTINPDLDRNGDGTITYLPIGDVSASVKAANDVLTEKGLPTLVAAAETADVAIVAALTEGTYANEKNNETPLLNTADGVSVELIITDNDAVALDILKALNEKNFNKTDKTRNIPLYTAGSLTPAMDFTTVDEDLSEEDKALYVYTICELIDSSKAAGTVTEDYDTICASACAAARSFIKGEAIAETIVKVPYAKYE